MIVADASVVLEILRQTSAGVEFQDLLFQHSVHAPYLLDIEVTHGLRRLERSAQMDVRQALNSLAILRDMRIQRYPHTPLLDEIWKLRHNLTAYDATYLALALWLRADLVTMDAGLRNEALRHGVKVLR